MANWLKSTDHNFVVSVFWKSSASVRNLMKSIVEESHSENHDLPSEIRGNFSRLPREAELGRSPMAYQTISDQTMDTIDVGSLVSWNHRSSQKSALNSRSFNPFFFLLRLLLMVENTFGRLLKQKLTKYERWLVNIENLMKMKKT